MSNTIPTSHYAGPAPDPLAYTAESMKLRFKCPVEVWQYANGWKMQWPEGGNSPLNERFDCEKALQLYLDNSQSQLLPLSGGHFFLMPVNSDLKKPTVAIGITPLSEAQMWQRSLEAGVDAAQFQFETNSLNEQMDLYASQVSADFEEMSYLRRLAENLCLATVEHKIKDVAKGVLDELRHIVGCETVGLVTEPHAGYLMEQKYQFEWYGSEVDPVMAHLIVDEWRERADHSPVVINETALRELKLPYTVRSFMLIPIMKDGKRYGWLIAVNKILAENCRTHLNDANELVSEIEFGTSEASLLKSTGNMLASHLKNLDLFEQKNELLIGTIRTMMNAVDAKDPYTCGHSDRVALYAKQISFRLGMSPEFCEQIFVAGLVHDIGKVGIPDHILKKPGKLTEQEFAEIKKHPEVGYSILKHLKELAYVLPAVLHHHESMDGTGYPLGLVGEDIPLSARILAVADAFDAMTSTRPYREGMPTEKAISILLDGAGSQWDANCVDAFMAGIEEIFRITRDWEDHMESILSDPGLDLAEENQHSVQAAVLATSKL